MVPVRVLNQDAGFRVGLAWPSMSWQGGHRLAFQGFEVIKPIEKQLEV